VRKRRREQGECRLSGAFQHHRTSSHRFVHFLRVVARQTSIHHPCNVHILSATTPQRYTNDISLVRAPELRDQGHAEALRLEYAGISQERLGRRRAYSPGNRPRQIGWERLYRPISRNVAIFCRPDPTTTIDSYRYFRRVADYAVSRHLLIATCGLYRLSQVALFSLG